MGKRSTINSEDRKSSFSNVKWILATIVLVGLTAAVTLFVSDKLKKEESTTIFVEQVREIAMLATAEAKITLVKEEVENKFFGKDIQFNLPGTKREIMLVVPATVLAGVDLSKLTENDMKIDEEAKTLEIVLPRATFLHEPTIQMEHLKTFSDKGLLSGEVKWDEGFDIAAIAQEEIKQEATEMGVLESAEQNAEKALKAFFSNLDYSVTVEFK